MRTLLRVVCFLALAGGALEAVGQLSPPLNRALVLVAASVLAASLLRDRSPRAAAEMRATACALALVLLFAELERALPVLWHLQSWIARSLSHLAAGVAREPRNLGHTAMALPLLGALLALSASRAACGAASRRPSLWVFALGAIAAHFGYLLALTPLAHWIATRHPTWEGLLLNSQWLFIAIGAAVFTVLQWIGERLATPATGGAEPVGRSAALRTARAPRVWLGFGLGFALMLVAIHERPPHPTPVRVLLYDAGYTNWKIPQHGEYGEKSGGMFGLLPGFLQAAGCDVVVTKDLSRLEGAGAPDCLALINIQEFLDPADKERILQFVARGGGLLCLGDHTGVAGIRGPFNDLLSPLGIRFRFDSASFFAGSWANALERRPHPINRTVRDDEEFQIWVGASLEVDSQAEPVVVARYGYSDLGDMANLRMAFLGDRRYNPSEQLGDIVLVAEARHGQGKVLVFGDTSTYQNLALQRSWKVVLHSFQYLGQRTAGRAGVPAQIAILLVFAAGLVFASRRGRAMEPVLAAVAGMLVANAVIAVTTRQEPEPPLRWQNAAPVSLEAAAGNPAPTRNAVLDRSHGGRFDLRAWYDPSIGGLMLNLVRDGFFPVVADQFPSQSMLDAADLIVLIAPVRSYSTHERAALRRFMEKGGRLLVCVGREEFDGARSLVAEQGFDVLDVPLAHFRTGETSEDLVFAEAWALRCPPEARVLVRQWDQPVVASRTVGRGEFMLVGDSSWLWNRNLEGRDKWFLGNIRFLSALGTGAAIVPVEGRFGKPHDESAPVADVPAAAPHVHAGVPGGTR